MNRGEEDRKSKRRRSPSTESYDSVERDRKSRHREKDRDRDRDRDRNRDREREREKVRERGRDRNREKKGEKPSEKEREKDSAKGRDRERYREKMREKDHKSSRRTRSDSRSPSRLREKHRKRDNERDRDSDREKDKDRERDRRDRRSRSADRGSDRHRSDKDKDREKDRETDREKDNDRDMLHHPWMRKQHFSKASSIMTTKDINVNGKVFRCPVGWTATKARDAIRSQFSLHGGGINHNNVRVRETELISSFSGTLVFVGGQPFQKPGPPQSQIPHNAELDQLYEALVTAEEVDEKIQLKDGHYFPVEAHDTLIVRKADRHIFRLFDELILNGKSIKDETFTRMVVAGPEGVGKSWCSMYFLVMLLKRGYTVVYESVEKKVTWVFSKHGTRKIRRIISLEDVLELESNNTVHLFDAKAGNNSYEIMAVNNGARQIVFSSNNVSSYKQFKRTTCYVAGFPSTDESEFMRYVDLFKTTPAVVDKVTELCEFRKVRPLRSFLAYEQDVEDAIKEFNPRDIRNYATPNHMSTSKNNPAILLCAMAGKELDEDEENIEELHLAYHSLNVKWDLCSNYIAKAVLSNYRSEADDIVSSLYQSLKDDRNLTIGPFVGRLFEIQAPSFISKVGLKCMSVFDDPINQITKTIGKDFVVKDCEVMPLAQIISNCKDPNTIYSFRKGQHGFDCFIYPNFFLGCTHSLQDQNTRGSHPILLSFAKATCDLLASEVNYVTVVPEDQVEKWNKMQSFKVNIEDVVNQIIRLEGKEEAKRLKNGGQRALEKLPEETKSAIDSFKQYVGVVVI